ncbi:ABC transporter ATP-binding protein [Bariatricus sp. HCP28S3_D3]|uniref:ABC transporter ATP-binding protein n=1 Tax=Bariatricus sp. HCP28S3_D3 TaxID=3438901 RepID=UPI003F89B891
MKENTNKMTREPILEIKNLRVLFPVHKKWYPAVDGVNLSIRQGEITGVVGESGSGKSVMSQSVLRLRDHDTAVRYEGEIVFEGQDLLKLPLSKMRDIRGDRISVIFQDPLTSLSPVHTVGKQLSEVLILHRKLSKQEAKQRAVEMLKITGIPNPENCYRQYPFELSGGMQQRVMIAMALACEPKLLIADEPTTALDVTIQEQILQLIRKLNDKLGMSVLFITHDMGAVSQLCHSVRVMYLGQVVEEAKTEELFEKPLHPYTQGLLACIPHLGVEKGRHLPVVPGTVPPLTKIPEGCHFCTRCKDADERCRKTQPPLCEAEPGHLVKCWKYADAKKQEQEG